MISQFNPNSSNSGHFNEISELNLEGSDAEDLEKN
jgi:hypothetical protein